MRSTAILVAVALSTGALAQPEPSCTTVNGFTSCSSSSRGLAEPVDVQGAYRHQQQAKEQREAELRQLQEALVRCQKLATDLRAAKQADVETKQRVGELVAAGDCAAAERLALERGDFELAKKAGAYCAGPRSAPK